MSKMSRFDTSDIDFLLSDNIELSDKVAAFLKFDDFDEFIEGVNSDGLFDEDVDISEEKVKNLIKTFKKMEEFIKKRNIHQESEIKNIESRINEITEEINAFDPSKLDQESLEALANLIKEKESLNNKKTKIKLDCVKNEKLLQMFNKVNIKMNDIKIDIASGKNSEEKQKIESELKNVKDKLAENEKQSNELSNKIGTCNNEIEKNFEDLKKISSKDGVLSDEDQKKQNKIFAELDKKVAERKNYEEKIAFLEKSTQELEDKKEKLEDKKEKNAKNIRKQEKNDLHIEDRISKFEELAEKENLTKIEMGIFKGIYAEITRSPNITSAEKNKLHDKYIKKLSGVVPNPSEIETRDGVKEQKKVAEVSRIKSRVAKAKVSTLLFIKSKFDKAVNKRSEFKEKSIDKKTQKLKEKSNKINTKITELDNMKVRLQNLYTNNPNLEQEDVPSARRM